MVNYMEHIGTTKKDKVIISLSERELGSVCNAMFSEYAQWNRMKGKDKLNRETNHRIATRLFETWRELRATKQEFELNLKIKAVAIEQMLKEEKGK